MIKQMFISLFKDHIAFKIQSRPKKKTENTERRKLQSPTKYLEQNGVIQ